MESDLESEADKHESPWAIGTLISLGAAALAATYGLSWAFLGGFYSSFGLSPVEVGIGYEDALTTFVVFASVLGASAFIAGLCVLAIAVFSGRTLQSRLALGCGAAIAAGIFVGASNNLVGPPTWWIVYSFVVALGAPVLVAMLARRSARQIVLLAIGTYLLLLPYARQLGLSLSELVPIPETPQAPRTTLVPRWPTLVCVYPVGSDIALPIGPNWSEPILFFGTEDGLVSLVQPDNPDLEDNIVIRLSSENVYLLSLSAFDRRWADETDCSTESITEMVDRE